MIIDGSLAQIGVRESVADTARVLGRQASADRVADPRAVPARGDGRARRRTRRQRAHRPVPPLPGARRPAHRPRAPRRPRRPDAHLRRRRRLQHGAQPAARRRDRRDARAGQRPRRLPARTPRSSPGPRRSPQATGGSAAFVADPVEAATGADVLATDTWVSMGREAEAEARAEVFAPWQLNDALLALRRRRRDRAALPARLPRQGDHRRGDRRPAQRGLGRGREPPARAEGRASSGCSRRTSRA